MKIEPNGLTPITPKKTDATEAAGRKPAPQGGAGAAQRRDRAEVSETSRLLAKANAALNELTPEERERVEKLRQQISDGTYTIPVDELARRLAQKRYFESQG
jgi:flagellar biosynthesis anti-sigma factor FlgM